MLAEIAAHLQDQGVGVVGQDIFRHRLPDEPSKAMVLTPYAGSPGPHIHDAVQPAFRIERFQVMGRAETRALAMALANAAYAALWIDNLLLGAVQIVRCEPQQPPFDLPEDARNRAIVAFNVTVWSA